MKTTLVLCDGGLKSVFLAALAYREGKGVLLYLDDPSLTLERKEREWRAVKQIGEYYGMPCHQQLLPVPMVLNGSRLAFLCQALYGIEQARQHQCGLVYHGLGAHDIPSRDRSHFDTFMQQFQQLLELGQTTWYKETYCSVIPIETPLRHLSLVQILVLARSWYIPWHLAHSCDKNYTLPCGHCPSCTQRKSAFQAANINDPF